MARRRGYTTDMAGFPGWGEVLREVNRSKWALLFPVFLVVGIRFGIFTPSEVGAFAVVYAVAVGVFAYRELDWKRFNEALRHSVHDIGMIMLIIMLSAMIGYVIALERVPQNAAEWIVGVTQNPQVLMSMLVVFILLLGMFLESTVIVLLLTPILVPIVTKAGIDPVHFGLVMMTATTLGGMTPPVGVAMYTVCGLLDDADGRVHARGDPADRRGRRADLRDGVRAADRAVPAQCADVAPARLQAAPAPDRAAA